MELTKEQRIEMMGKAREYSATGSPEKRQAIMGAMGRNEFYLGEAVPGAVDLPDQPPTHGKGSSGKAWRDYATAYSDFDQEIIDTTPKQDLIKMLKAHGLAE